MNELVVTTGSDIINESIIVKIIMKLYKTLGAIYHVITSKYIIYTYVKSSR